jgi:hypothetical protein
MRNLGKTQLAILKSLIEHKEWRYHGPGHSLLCGWIYNTYSNTYKVMLQLFDKGLVEKRTRTIEGVSVDIFLPRPSAYEHIERNES